jgi:hypothetical protein
MQKIIWVPSLVSVCAVLLLMWLWGCHSLLTLRVDFAQEQVQVFSLMRDKACKGSVEQALDGLEYAAYYYTSGSKQVTGSPLDEVVETARKLAMENIITFLRQKSGMDFGDNPKAWLENRKVLVAGSKTAGE